MLNETNPDVVAVTSKEIFKLPQEFLKKTAIENYIKKLTVSFASESYFLYNKSNVIEPTLITEINKLISVYGSISYFDKKSANDIVKIIPFNNPLKFSMVKNTIKNTLEFQVTNINGTLPPLEDKKVHNFYLTERKRSKIMAEPIETVIIRGQ